MLRTTLTTFAGVLLGVVVSAALMVGCNLYLRWLTAPQVFAVEHRVIYQGVVLGAGFGGVCGALVGLAGRR